MIVRAGAFHAANDSSRPQSAKQAAYAACEHDCAWNRCSACDQEGTTRSD